jgi:hypothetical protein
VLGTCDETDPTEPTGNHIHKVSLQYMAFADDVLLGRNTGTLIEALQRMTEGLGHLGFRTNTDKTKYMVNMREKERFQGMEDWNGKGIQESGRIEISCLKTRSAQM